MSGDASVRATTGAPVPVALKSWWMVAVLFSLYVFSWLDRLILSMLVGPIKADLVLSDFQISLLLGPAFAVFYALFGLPLGWAVDRYARRWVVFFGVVLWAAATVASGFARSFEALLLARVCVGIGEAALIPAAYSLLADEFPRERLTVATSVFQMAGKVGSATAFGLGGIAIAYATTLDGTDWPFLGQAAAWHLVLIMVGLPGFLMALLIFTFREPPRRDAPGVAAMASKREGGRGALVGFVRENWKLVGLMMIGFSFMAICGYTLTSWVPTYLGRIFHWTPLQYGPALSVMNIIAAGSLVVNGRVVDHLFGKGMKDAHLRFYSWLILALAPAGFFMFTTDNAWLFLACYCVVQFTTVPFMIYVSSVIALLAPNAVRGQLIAVFLFVFTILGMGAGPAIVGALTDFVFKDEVRIGSSLMIVTVTCFIGGYAAMRLSLRHLAPAVLRAEGAARAPIAS